MGGIDGELSGEGAAQGFVSGDEDAEALVDLSVGPFTALLDGRHDQQTDADADDSDEGECEEGREEILPRAEVDISHRLQCPRDLGG